MVSLMDEVDEFYDQPCNMLPLSKILHPRCRLPLKANECMAHQWLKILRSRIDLFGFLNAVMAVSDPFDCADEASLWTSRCRIHQKSHLRSCPFKVWSLLTTQLLNTVFLDAKLFKMADNLF